MNCVSLIRRNWIKGISIESNITIEIWDSGSYIYERWPDGDVCWKLVSREITPTGFSEILQKMPEWFSPGEVLHWEQVPLVIQSPLQYQLGQWNVTVEEQPEAQAQAKLPLQLQGQAKLQAQVKPQVQVQPQVKQQVQAKQQQQVQVKQQQQVQAKLQLQSQVQAKPLQQNYEKMGGRGGRMQGQSEHMRHVVKGGAAERNQPNLPVAQKNQGVRVLQRGPLMPKGQMPKGQMPKGQMPKDQVPEAQVHPQK